MSDHKQPGKRIALGKGLSSLLGGEPSPANPMLHKASEVSGAVSFIECDSICANPNQPRKLFDEKDLRELAASIEQDGVLQPIIIRKHQGPTPYIIVAGERRWRASKLAGKEKIPAIIKDGTEEELMRLALIENIQRADLNSIEEAQAFQSLMDDFGLTQEQCSKKVGKSRSSIANSLRLLTLPLGFQDDLMEGLLTTGHAKALLGITDSGRQKEIRDWVVQNSLSVRETEQLISGEKTEGAKTVSPSSSSKAKSNAKQVTDPDLLRVIDNMRTKLQTKVKIVGSPTRGKIEIAYFSLADLERVTELIQNA
jgi:ParB family chromosome partitioning protein